MKDAKKTISMLQKVFDSWETVITANSSDILVKDILAHLMSWQQISIARLMAAKNNTTPVMPDWLDEEDPESEERKDEFNARISTLFRERPWQEVHAAWRDGFLMFLTLAKEIAESEMFDTTKYLWLKGYSLHDVLKGSLEHHTEHLESYSTHS